VRTALSLFSALLVLAPVVGLGPGLHVPDAHAEVYRWVDAEGTLHFTTSLHEVPPAHRTRARQAASGADEPAAGSLSTVSRPAAAAPLPARARRHPDPTRVYTVAVERAGSSLLVPVKLNDRVTAPFLIDTGASDVLVPQAVADELGLDTGPDVRRARYATANGIVEHPVVMLDAVELGGARVEGVPASVSPHLGVGLLGLSFFNHFRYEVDAAAGVVRLRPNDLAERGLLRGGRSQAQWRTEFASLAERRRQVESRLAARTGGGAERARLRSMLADLERDEDLLAEEADDAGVPQRWRH